MKNFFIALLLGLILGAGIVWYISGKKLDDTTKESSSAMASLKNTAESVRTAIDAKLDILHLKSDQIKEELAEKGRVVRSQSREWASGAKESMSDAAITAKIKSKYALNKEVSALNISVNTTAGVVTLSGYVSSSENIAKAIVLAMETDGVREVISTLQVQPKAKPETH